MHGSCTRISGMCASPCPHLGSRVRAAAAVQLMVSATRPACSTNKTRHVRLGQPSPCHTPALPGKRLGWHFVIGFRVLALAAKSGLQCPTGSWKCDQPAIWDGKALTPFLLDATPNDIPYQSIALKVHPHTHWTTTIVIASPKPSATLHNPKRKPPELGRQHMTTNQATTPWQVTFKSPPMDHQIVQVDRKLPSVGRQQP